MSIVISEATKKRYLQDMTGSKGACYSQRLQRMDFDAASWFVLPRRGKGQQAVWIMRRSNQTLQIERIQPTTMFKWVNFLLVNHLHFLGKALSELAS